MADKNTNKKNTGFALACWILVALILVILFLVNKETIVSNLKKSGFFDRVFGSTPEFVKNHKDKESPAQSNDVIQIDVQPTTEEPAEKPVETEESKVTPVEPPVESHVKETENLPLERNTQETEKKESKPVIKNEKPKIPAVKTIDTQICFVIIDSDGSVSRKMVKRSLTQSDVPLTASINSLLAGPTPAEAGKDCMSLIPKGTKLLGASVKNGVATLNFSEEFEYNSVGVEGYIGQLMQIVYTATEFKTVQSVQFIVNGEKKEYLGLEGQWIGSPLSRTSFR